MTPEAPLEALGAPFEGLAAPLAAALEGRGFTALTSVQEAVLDPALAGRDLRMSSQTGSGKTVAIGIVLAGDFERAAAEQPEGAEGSSPRADKGAPSGPKQGFRPVAARPSGLVIVPTRELAAQVAREFAWLLSPLGIGVSVVTGGTSYVGELRDLRSAPRLIVGTPGRLLDHLERGSIDPTAVCSVVLDEADQMLDLGFRDALEAILGRTPATRRTHLVSATFPHEVTSLANRYQRDAARIEGTAAGNPNADIAHVAHLVLPHEREAALRNLLLLTPNERTLVFVRTRADAADIADRLADLGFSALSLSGELEQRERTRTLEAFRSGAVGTLVATDVAARGLDIPDVACVVHVDLPGDVEAFTHRSGRTGRAGRKGISVVLVPPAARESALRLFRRARVEATWRPVPSPADILGAADERLRLSLTSLIDAPATDGGTANDAPKAEGSPERLRALAERLVAELDPVALVTALLARTYHAGPCAPKALTRIEPRPMQLAQPRAPRPAFQPGPGGSSPFVPFTINWGERQGADARRLLAMVCRRGQVDSRQIGAIRVFEHASTFEVAAPSAEEFARSVKRPDARDPRIRIDAMGFGPARSHDGPPPSGPRAQAFSPRQDGPPPGSKGPRFAPRQEGFSGGSRGPAQPFRDPATGPQAALSSGVERRSEAPGSPVKTAAPARSKPGSATGPKAAKGPTTYVPPLASPAPLPFAPDAPTGGFAVPRRHATSAPQAAPGPGAGRRGVAMGPQATPSLGVARRFAGIDATPS